MYRGRCGALRYRLLRAAAAGAVAFTAAAGHALLIRADRDDAEYLEMATRYTSFIAIGGEPGAGGVLVNSRWMLTGAAAGRALEGQEARVVRIGGRDHAIERVVVHPGWKGSSDHALAMVLLRHPVRDVEPTPVYSAEDEAGKTVIVVGAGFSGKIGEKASRNGWDRKPRAAVNTVDKLDTRTLFLKIKDKDDASDLQAAAAPGDGGGPAFVNTPEGLRVIGVGYGPDDSNGNGIAGDIGDEERYVRVSADADWILRTMLDVAREDAAKLMGG